MKPRKRKETQEDLPTISESKPAEESPVVVELIDRALVHVLIITVSVYVVVFAIFSLLFGNAFGAFVATPIAGIAFFLVSRWDRLRISPDTLQTTKIRSFTNSIRIDFQNIFIGVISIFFVQFLVGIVVAQLDRSNFAPQGFAQTYDHIFSENILAIAMTASIYFSAAVGGYVSACIAIGRGFSPYLHSILTTVVFFVISFVVTFVAFILEGADFESALGDNEISVGAKILFLLSLLVPTVIMSKAAILLTPEVIGHRKSDEKEVKEMVKMEIERLRSGDNSQQVKRKNRHP